MSAAKWGRAGGLAAVCVCVCVCVCARAAGKEAEDSGKLMLYQLKASDA